METRRKEESGKTHNDRKKNSRVTEREMLLGEVCGRQKWANSTWCLQILHAGAKTWSTFTKVQNVSKAV